MSSLFTSYGEYYTKVFYISLCLNGSVREETFKHPIFHFEKGSQSNVILPSNQNNTAKIRTIFVIANFFRFFLPPIGQSVRENHCYIGIYLLSLLC